MRRVGKACFSLAAIAAACTLTVACNKNPAAPDSTPQSYAPIAGGAHALPAAAAAPADDGNWTMPGKNYAATRFSALNQITSANVSKLALSFTFSTGTNKGFEAPPLVVDGTMYIVTPFPNIVYALDLTKPGAPAKWVF
jgi:glucose dehydrogenase